MRRYHTAKGTTVNVTVAVCWPTVLEIFNDLLEGVFISFLLQFTKVESKVETV